MRERQQKKQINDTNPLADALDSFNATVSDLGFSYHELKKRIEELNVELSEKNRQLEENLFEVKRLRKFLDSILNSMTDGVVVIDNSGKIVLFNAGAEILTGYNSKEVIGKSYNKVFGKQVSERFSPLYTLAHGVSLFLEEKEIKTKSGKPIPVRYSTSLVTASLNRTLGAVEVLSDLTRIKRLEDEMQRIKTQIALNQMAGLVAHEIRNPLGGIRGYVDLLAESMKKSDPRRKMLNNIKESVKRLDEIVADFQLFARPVKPHFEEIDLSSFINDVLTFFKRGADLKNKKINVAVVFPSDKKSIHVNIDPILLEQAILAVLDNAVKAMEGGGTLRVELQQGKSYNKHIKDHISFIISDTGEGMSEKVLNKLFTPFFTTRERGLGLGLSMVRNFISFHHGDIFVESEKGKGSTVTIVLPA